MDDTSSNLEKRKLVLVHIGKKFPSIYDITSNYLKFEYLKYSIIITNFER